METCAPNDVQEAGRRRAKSLVGVVRSFRPALFVLPALVFYVVFAIWPILGTIRYSFFNWDGASPTMQFVGLGNYQKLLSDPLFWTSFRHNMIWIVATVAIPVCTGLILAWLLSLPGIRGRVFFRVTYFMPVVVSLVAVGIVWSWIYDPSYGVLDDALRRLGLGILAAAWLGNPHTVLGALIAAASWTYYGFCMVIFLAAIQGIDPSYYEAAKLEGCTTWQSFVHITVPLLKNVITLVVLNSLIASFKVFDIVYIMTKGGPFHSSEVIGTYMYSAAFNDNQVGYGAAVSIFLSVVIALVSIVYMRLAERE
ncbi:MAG: sugar ABC transporter permease [Alicyclobacillus sp.]|nr:sugar ABC transporter permease [Alicyclobacillus sp.]